MRPGLRRSIPPKPEEADQFLADGAAPFGGDPSAPILQIALAGNPDEITADERFPIHAVRAIDQQLILPRHPLSTMALAGEDIDRLEVDILATIRLPADRASGGELPELGFERPGNPHMHELLWNSMLCKD